MGVCFVINISHVQEKKDMIKRMKKNICLLITFSILLPFLSSCGSSPAANNVTDAPAAIVIETNAPTPEPTSAPTSILTPTPSPSDAPTFSPAPVSTEEPAEMSATYNLSPDQLKAIGIINYLAVLLQDINSQGVGNKVYLQEMFTSLSGNTHPDVVDPRTQSEITDILSTLSSLSMLAEKREHLSYIYDQKRALTLFSLIPNPLTILNVVQSANHSDDGEGRARLIASVIHMAASSVSTYLTDKAINELQFLQDGWELDEEEKRNLNRSIISAFNYLMDMKNYFQLKGKDVLLTLNEKKVKDFVDTRNLTNVHRRIAALEDNRKTYEAFGEYWLLLATCYYENGQYQKCLDAVGQFESLGVQIFIKDFDFAKVLTLAVLSAEEILPKEEFVPLAERYLDLIIENTYDDNWDLRYFASVKFLELYGKTNEQKYLNKAYSITKATTNKLISKQLELNTTYLKEIDRIDVGKMSDKTEADKKKRKEAEAYNKTLEENRKKELPPIYEPFWLNCNLLFKLAKLCDISSQEKSELEGMLHGNEIELFLNKPLNHFFRFNESDEKYDLSGLEFNKGTLIIPAIYVTDDSSIHMRIYGTDPNVEEEIDDWILERVERKNKDDINSFVAVYRSEKASKLNYGSKEMIAILSLQPKALSDITTIRDVFKLKYDYFWFVCTGSHFEREKP